MLLAEDNGDLNSANSRVLLLRGFAMQTALTLAQERERLSGAESDIILLDCEKSIAFLYDENLRLSEPEFDALYLLVKEKGALISAETLYKANGGYPVKRKSGRRQGWAWKAFQKSLT